jgi:hypothetical protein
MGRLGFPPPPVASIPALRASSELFGLKTHSQHRPGRDHALYFVRDGRDALISYAYYVHEWLYQQSREQITPEQLTQTLHDLLLDPDPDIGSWSDNVSAWHAQPDVAVIPFSQLITRPIETITAALDRFGLPYTRLPVDPPTFPELRGKVPSFFRAGRIGDWRDRFPAKLLPLFWERHGDTMRRLGLVEWETASAG